MWGFFCFFFSRAYRCELSASQSLQMSVLRVCVSVCVYFWRLRCNSLSSASGWRGTRGTIPGFGCSFKDATHRSGFRAQINEGTPLRMTLVSWFLFFSSIFLPSWKQWGKKWRVNARFLVWNSSCLGRGPHAPSRVRNFNSPWGSLNKNGFSPWCSPFYITGLTFMAFTHQTLPNCWSGVTCIPSECCYHAASNVCSPD